jgi:hypothetical protein
MIVAPQLGANRFFEFGYSSDCGVLGLARRERFARCVFDSFGRVKVGFARIERDYIDSRGAHFLSALVGGEGRGRPQGGYTAIQFEHVPFVAQASAGVTDRIRRQKIPPRRKSYRGQGSVETVKTPSNDDAKRKAPPRTR